MSEIIFLKPAIQQVGDSKERIDQSQKVKLHFCVHSTTTEWYYDHCLSDVQAVTGGGLPERRQKKTCLALR